MDTMVHGVVTLPSFHHEPRVSRMSVSSSTSRCRRSRTRLTRVSGARKRKPHSFRVRNISIARSVIASVIAAFVYVVCNPTRFGETMRVGIFVSGTRTVCVADERCPQCAWRCTAGDLGIRRWTVLYFSSFFLFSPSKTKFESAVQERWFRPNIFVLPLVIFREHLRYALLS